MIHPKGKDLVRLKSHRRNITTLVQSSDEAKRNMQVLYMLHVFVFETLNVFFVFHFHVLLSRMGKTFFTWQYRLYNIMFSQENIKDNRIKYFSIAFRWRLLIHVTAKYFMKFVIAYEYISINIKIRNNWFHSLLD